MDEEATRLSHDPRKQKAASQPLDSVGVAGPVEVQEVDEREHRQHPGMGVPSPEELLSELLGGPPFCTASMMPPKDPWRELRRILLPRTTVNRAEEGPELLRPGRYAATCWVG